MRKKISFILLFLLTTAFSLNALAQTPDEAYAVKNSALSAIDLPSGAMRIRDKSIPAEIKDTLAKLVAAGGNRIKQGESEVVIWAGNGYKKTDNPRLLKQLESNLKNGGWEFDAGERTDEFVLFSLLHTESRRGLVGFFVPTEDAFIFAVVEMLRADSNASGNSLDNSINDQTEKLPTNNGGNSAVNTSSLVGKWQSAKMTDTTLGSYETVLAKGSLQFTYEFFPDGTFAVTQTATNFVGACWTKEIVSSRGRANLNGDSLTVNVAPAALVFDASCEKKYEKSLPAKTETIKINVKDANGQKQLIINAGKGDIVLKPNK